MALKSGRKIVVRDREFRWKISGNKRNRQYGSPRRPHLVVQEAVEKPGTALCVYLDSLRWVSEEEHEYTPHKASVTPKDTRAVIEAALDHGWDPSSRFIFSLCTKVPDMELTDYVVRTLDGLRHG
jgi:hypothetical protein